MPDIPQELITLVITALGSGTGAIAAFKLMVYRVEQLERKVEKYSETFEAILRMQQVLEYHGQRIAQLEEDDRYDKRHRD